MTKVKFLPFFIIVFVLFIAACSNKKQEENANAVPAQDTAGLAEYQKWKLENEVRAKIEAENADAQQTTTVVAPVRSSAASSGSSSSRSHVTYESRGNSPAPEGTPAPATASEPAPASQKKGMSHTAKGAIVGAVTGAATGAIANKKNRLGGGVVGGVVGAAAGAGIGAIVDKKEKQKDDN
ncbi:MAG: glycine zipper domain-containing protein [Niabella sp.]